MIKKLLSLFVTTSVVSVGLFSHSAFAYDPLIQLILEKKVIGTLKGSHAIINPNNIYSQQFNSIYQPPLSRSSVVYQQYPYHLLKKSNRDGTPVPIMNNGPFWNEMPSNGESSLSETSFAFDEEKTSASDDENKEPPPRLKKHFQILEDASHFQSVISVKNDNGEELSRISVGRRALRLIPHPWKNRLYVLCGGYFGSVWEIDTSRDIVLRKLPIWRQFSQNMANLDKSTKLWNPQDLFLEPHQDLLWVSSGQGWQSINLNTGTLSASSKKSKGFQANLFKYANRYLTASVVTPVYEDFDYNNLSFVASRNADFIHVLDTQSGKNVGMIPVDFPVNDLLLSHDRKRMFAYHAEFGQISVIDLEPFSKHRLSVVSRIRHPNFVSPTATSFMLAQNDEDIYLWDGTHKAIGAIDVWTLVPRFDLPFRVGLFKQNEKVWVSKVAHKRFYLKNGELYIERYGEEGRRTPFRGKRVDMGQRLSAIALSNDQRKLFILDSLRNRLIVMDVFDNHPEYSLEVGKNPKNLVVSNERVYVLNADESTISNVSIAEKRVSSTLLLNTERYQPYVVTIFDPALTQLIHLEVPRYLQNAELMVG